MDWTHQVMVQCRHNKTDGVATLRNDIISVCSTDEIHLLLQYIPSLKTIIYDNNDDSEDTETDTDKDMGGNDMVNDVTVNANEFETTGIIRDDIQSRIDGTSTMAPTFNSKLPKWKQFAVALHSFLRAISSSSSSSQQQQQPMVLVLENLQHADPSSIDVLCYILNNSIPGIVIAGTYVGSCFEDNEAPTAGSNNYLVDRVRETERNSQGTLIVQTVSIRDLNHEQVKHGLHKVIMTKSLQKSEKDLDELCALISKETHGNMFLITEFMRWLQDNGLLTKSRMTTATVTQSNDENDWTWNMDDIHRSIAQEAASSLSSDQALVPQFETKFYISSRFKSLPKVMLDMLKVGACMGSSYIETKIVDYVLNCPIQPIIHDAARMGILELNGEDHFSFIHDEMKNAVYNLTSEEDRELLHLKIGRRLWSRLDQNELDQYIFVILNQLYIGRRSISDSASNKYRIATLCLHAGESAAKTSIFHVALRYFYFGIELLGGESGWCDEYDLSLMTHNAAAEMESCLSNYEGCAALVAEVIRHCRRPEDAIPARTTHLHSLLVSGRQQEGLDLGLELLSNLGHGLPKSFSSLRLRWEMNTVQRLLQGKSNEFLKRMPFTYDEKVLASMHVLNLMILHALLERPAIAPFVTLKMMHLTLRYGMSFISPLAFGVYAMLCVSSKSDRDAAFRFGKLALELIETLQVREYVPRVYAAYYSCVHPWKYPIQDSFEQLMYGHQIALETGDVEFSLMCAKVWLYHASAAGIPLDEKDKQCTFFHNSLQSCRQQSLRHMTVPVKFYIRFNRGQDIDLDEMDKLLHSVDGTGGLHTVHSIKWTKAEIAIFYNDLEHSDEMAISAGLSKNFSKLPSSPDLVNLMFVNGMIAFACLGNEYDGTRRRSRRQYILEGKAMIRSLKSFARWCPVNFIHKQFLLEAEYAVAVGRSTVAIEKYICAIGAAREHRNLQVLGWANERYGRYYFNILNCREVAAVQFKQALSSYAEWKGQRKSDELSSDLLRLYGEKDYSRLFVGDAYHLEH